MTNNISAHIALRKKIAITVTAVALIAIAVPAMMGGAEAFRIIAELPAGYTAGLGLVMFVVWNLNLLRLRMLLNGQTVNLSYWRMLRIYMATEFVSKTTPAGAGSPIAAITLLAPHGVTASSCLAIFGVAACMDAITVALFILTFVLFGPIGIDAVNTVLAAVVITALAVILPGIMYVLQRKRIIVLYPLAAALNAASVKARNKRRAYRIVIRLSKAIEELSGLPPWRLWVSWAACIAYWFIYLSTMFLCITVIGHSVDWETAGFIQLISMGVGHLLMIPGGAGGTEISGGLMLAPLIGYSAAASVILIWRFMMLQLYLVVGGLSLASLASVSSREARE